MTTVTLRPRRWRASWSVVVPMSIITVCPSATSSAAARPIRSFSARRSTAICSNGGSSRSLTAPPCTRLSRPSSASCARSRRTVISDTVEALRRARPPRRSAPRADGVEDQLSALCCEHRLPCDRGRWGRVACVFGSVRTCDATATLSQPSGFGSGQAWHRAPTSLDTRPGAVVGSAGPACSISRDWVRANVDARTTAG